MKKLIVRALFALAVLAAVPATTFANDEWSNRAQASAAAHQVNNTASDFAQQVQWSTGYSHLAHDAQHFAQEAAHFHGTIESGVQYQHLVNDYYTLERTYNHLYRAFYFAHQTHHDPNIHEHWHQVEYAWQNLSWTFRGGHGPQ